MLRGKDGKWLPGSRPANLVTSETAHALLAKRELKRHLRQEAAGRGVIKAAAEYAQRPMTSDADAHEVIAEALVTGGLANVMDKPRDAWVGISGGLRLADQLEDQRQQQPPPSQSLGLLLANQCPTM